MKQGKATDNINDMLKLVNDTKQNKNIRPKLQVTCSVTHSKSKTIVYTRVIAETILAYLLSKANFK